MVEVDGAYKHGMYTQILTNSSHAMSNVEVFAMKNSHPADQTYMSYYTDPYDTHMDQNVCRIEDFYLSHRIEDFYLSHHFLSCSCIST